MHQGLIPKLVVSYFYFSRRDFFQCNTAIRIGLIYVLTRCLSFEKKLPPIDTIFLYFPLCLDTDDPVFCETISVTLCHQDVGKLIYSASFGKFFDTTEFKQVINFRQSRLPRLGTYHSATSSCVVVGDYMILFKRIWWDLLTQCRGSK